MKANRTRIVSLMGATAIGLLWVGIGCNTTKGVGKDVERAGEKLQNAADGAKR